MYEHNGSDYVKKKISTVIAPDMSIGDGDNDGKNEIYVSRHWIGIWKIYFDGTSWIGENIGAKAKLPLAIGDGNNNNLIEMYHAWDYEVYQIELFSPIIVTLQGRLTDTSNNPVTTGSLLVIIQDYLGTKNVWEHVFNDVLDNGNFNIPLGAQKPLILTPGETYRVIVLADADASTFTDPDVEFGIGEIEGDVIMFTA